MENQLWSLQDAKAQFSHLVESALHGRAQHVTRHGKPAVVVLAESDYIALQRSAAAQAPGFVAHLLAIPKPTPAKRAKAKQAEPARAKIALRDIDFS
ncbi:MAG: type II toxin-antitoxin system Phd/YefM family antitoxin [Brachymonas sp.]|nr:type II toxin-antitoxin system Phd/YefM family antitoxin [Brachymonas sp.]NJS36692.1 type II toxin-antitoxin system Phd/YefM family antitoxin [Brachymonas sp.]